MNPLEQQPARLSDGAGCSIEETIPKICYTVPNR